jgi:hypothetical protein
MRDTVESIQRTLEQDGTVRTEQNTIRLLISLFDPSKKIDTRMAQMNIKELIAKKELAKETVSSFMTELRLLIVESAPSSGAAGVRYQVPNRNVNQVGPDQARKDVHHDQSNGHDPITTRSTDLCNHTCIECHKQCHLEPSYTSNRKGDTTGGDGTYGGRQPPGNQGKPRTCYRCGQQGHFIANCPKPPNNVNYVTTPGTQKTRFGNKKVINVFTWPDYD